MARQITRDIERVRTSAETLQAAKLEVIGTASVGDVVRQGDLYLVCLDTLLQGRATSDRQLAPGTSQGSRHILTGECTVLVPECEQLAAVAQAINRCGKDFFVPCELVGPVIHCKAGVTLTHPDHGHKSLPDGSIWAVVYQRQYAEEIRRMQD